MIFADVSEVDRRHCNLNELIQQLENFADLDVRIGYIGGVDERILENDVNDINNATLAFLHEHGSQIRKIPARPFLRPSFEQNSEHAINLIARGLGEVLASANPNAQMYLPIFEKAGMFLRDKAKEWIVNQNFNMPLSARTLEHREKKGFKGTKALIETGQLLNGITYKVDIATDTESIF